MKEVDSTFSHELSINNEPKEPAVLIEHNEQPHEENPEEDDTPRTIEEAYSSPDVDYWKEAVRSEMDSIMSNGTWEVVERPYG
jgi:hypothetical protein